MLKILKAYVARTLITTIIIWNSLTGNHGARRVKVHGRGLHTILRDALLPRYFR